MRACAGWGPSDRQNSGRTNVEVRIKSDWKIVEADHAELLAADPDVYYVTDHYLNYTSVLVRLSRVTPDVLRDLLGMAHKFVTARRAR
jgi:hypothetical protein